MGTPQFRAVDSTTKLFDPEVRAAQAATFADASTVEGASVRTAAVAAGAPLRARTAIRTPSRIADITLDTYNSAGLTKTGSTLGATTAGTEGRYWVPLWQGKSFRASATIRVSKSTTSSYSMFGLSATATGSDPGTAGDWIGVAYVQGTGLVLRRNAAPGGDSPLVTDSNLADGQTYTVTLVWDASMHTAAVSGEFILQALITAADGSVAATGSFYSQIAYYPAIGTFVARTNAINAITDLQVHQSIGGDALAPSALVNSGYMTGVNGERMAVRIPTKPNGKLVMALHGRGIGNFLMFNSAQYAQTWQLLLANGYTIAMPDMGGNLWGNATAQAYIAACRDTVCANLNLDRKVLLWGSSMGGGTALTAIAKNTFGPEGVSAAYLAQPVCDIAAVYADNSSTFTEIPQLYPTTDAMNQYSPIQLPTANYAGVPLLFVSSPSDGTVAKAKNTDPMRAKLGSVTRTSLLVATGGHEDPSEFQAQACLSWYQTA